MRSPLPPRAHLARRAAPRRRGVATVEFLLGLPALLVLLGLVFQLGSGLLARGRTTQAARHAAWQAAATDTLPAERHLREWLSSDDARARETGSSSSSGLPGLGVLEAMAPGRTSVTVRVDSTFDSPLAVLPLDAALQAESTVLTDFWYTPEEEEGLWGFLGSALGNVLSPP